MKVIRRLMPCLALGLTLAVAGMAFAQNAIQLGNKKTESCCCSDSCSMMKDGAMKNHATSSDKHECCCCGDSCSMKKDGAMKNHTTSSDKGECCCGDSCATMKKDGAKSGAVSDKHECCGDSCNMKEMKDMKKS